MKTIPETDLQFICDIQAPCFQSLTPEETEFVRSSKTQVLFRKGENLTKQGTFSAYILFIIKGIAKQYIEGENTRNYNLRILQTGEFVGLPSVFTGNTFSYSAVALTDCQAFLIEKETITKLAQQNGSFGFTIIKRYCEQNADLYINLKEVLFKQMNGRLAHTLLYLNEIKQKTPDIFQLLVRKDLADFAAISTENTVKLLKTFEKEGLIQLNEKEINLIDIHHLQEISKKG